MIIKHNFMFVDGDIETDAVTMICVGVRKYREVHLCLASNTAGRKGSNIAFAQIVLHSSGGRDEADKVFDDAVRLGEEIARRWNAKGESGD